MSLEAKTVEANGSPALTTTVKKQIVLTQWLAVLLLLALIVLCLSWELWLSPLRPGGSWLALKALPLCIPLAGLLKNKMYTFRWLSLMVWIYFAEGAVRASSDGMPKSFTPVVPSSWLAGLEVLLCVALFAVCAAHVRLRLKHGKLLHGDDIKA